MNRSIGILCLSALLVGCGPADAPKAVRSVRVAAAADLRFAFPELIAAFAAEHRDIELVPTFGSSGAFATQLAQSAPFDVFLSADVSYPEALAARGRAEPRSVFTYAVGRLALWTRKTSTLDLASRGLSVLTDPTVAHVAIANPAHAPYGRAAIAALKARGLHDAVAPRLVLGDNVAQAAQFIESGAADVGLIAYSLGLAPTMVAAGRSVLVPAELHPPIVQGGCILKDATDRSAAATFVQFLRSAAARTVLLRFGFEHAPD